MREVFDYNCFNKDILLNANYSKRTLFPYACFDGLFDEDILNKINEEINLEQINKNTRNIEGEEVTIRSDFEDNESLPPNIKKVFDVINGGCFLTMLSKLAGINGLISDPYFDGAVLI
jgi:hypothetical protein